MTVDNHVKRGHPIVFALILIFAIIELSISAWLTSKYNAHHNYHNISQRDRVRFVLFLFNMDYRWFHILHAIISALRHRFYHDQCCCASRIPHFNLDHVDCRCSISHFHDRRGSKLPNTITFCVLWSAQCPCRVCMGNMGSYNLCPSHSNNSRCVRLTTRRWLSWRPHSIVIMIKSLHVPSVF